ncbi:MAG: 4Fe-4S ferredoxin, partial [Candidatus Methanomethylophilaceae archaeon]|nr:4Fe-4S ferredoxin [Candidatus Methanomethylophilaceae archaeon]
MIFVYSSTGNSLHLAQAIAVEMGDDVTNILDVPDGPVDVSMHDRIGFVAPVYFFNVPRIMRE